MEVLPRPVTSRTSVMPAAAASSTMYWSTGRSTTGNSSLGTALVAGRKRVARPAAGMTALTARRPVAFAFVVIEVFAPSLDSCPDMPRDYRPRACRGGCGPPEADEAGSKCPSGTAWETDDLITL